MELVYQGAGVTRGVWNFLLLLGRSAVALTRKERAWEGVQPQGRGLRSRPGLSPGALGILRCKGGTVNLPGRPTAEGVGPGSW